MARHAHLRAHARPAECTAPPPALEHAIAFPDGIPGFEACRHFVLLASDDTAPLQRIESVDGPRASFVGVDPRRVVPGYRCVLGPADMRSLQATADTTLLWLALVAVEADGTITANLRAPIVVNPDRMLGRQVLPNDGLYPVRHVIDAAGA